MIITRVVRRHLTSAILNTNIYVGTRKNNWMPESEKYLIGYKNRVSVFNIGVTSFFFSRAKSFVELAVTSGARGFFFGLLSNYANLSSYSIRLSRLNQLVSQGAWRGGLITNTKFFRTRLHNGNKKFSFVVAFRFDYAAFPLTNECNRIKIPLIAPVDSNSNANYIDYPIPGNSASPNLTYLLAREFTYSIYTGIQKRYILANSLFSQSTLVRKLNPSKRAKGRWYRRYNNNSSRRPPLRY